jgi:hypothetical protein
MGIKKRKLPKTRGKFRIAKRDNPTLGYNGRAPLFVWMSIVNVGIIAM